MSLQRREALQCRQRQHRKPIARSELQTLLIDETARQQAVEHIRSMIDHIEIHVGAERGNPEVILVGALAQILAFTPQNKTAASNGSGGRVLMVAGARCHLYRTSIKR